MHSTTIYLKNDKTTVPYNITYTYFFYLCMLNHNLTNFKIEMETTMYDNLLQLPLFQGLCKDDFTIILERVKFHFQSFQEGQHIAHQGKACKQLLFLLNGEVTIKTKDEEYGYTLVESLKSPLIIEPDSLFGMSPYYKSNYQAKTNVKTLSINKAYIYSELNNYEIFRINYLNLLSNQCQSAHKKLWNTHVRSLEEKFVNFLMKRCQKPSGEKKLHITMEDLGKLIDETRINVSRLLNEMQEKGLVQLKRKEIYIPELEKLSQELA